MIENLRLWDEFKETPPAVTKAFSRGGGFKGKAIDPMYVIRRLTEKFGPVGTGWGWEITDEDYIKGTPFTNKYENKKGEEVLPDYEGHVIIHKIRLKVWYLSDMLIENDRPVKCFTGEQFGLTTFVGEYKSGPFTDEEHAKKSVTDAIGKCAVQLGVGADVHMGLHDNSKYIHDLQDKLNAEKGAPKDTSKAGIDDIPLGEPQKSENADLTDDERKAKGLISKAQRKRLKTIASKQGWPNDSVKELLKEHGFSSSHDIKWQAYKKIVETIESMDLN